MTDADKLITTVYRGSIEVGTSYTAEWRAVSRVIELVSPSDSFSLAIDGGPEDERDEVYMEVVLLGPGGGSVVGRSRLWSDCFFDMSGKGKLQEAPPPPPSSSTSSTASSSSSFSSPSTGSVSKNRRKKGKGPVPPPPPSKTSPPPPPSSSSSSSETAAPELASSNSTKRYVLKATDIASEGIHKLQIHIFKPKNVWSFFRTCDALDLHFRMEITHTQSTNHATDLHKAFSEPIWTLVEPFHKTPLQEMGVPLPPSKGRVYRKPLVLLLGGHSSGKSTFINMLLKDKVMETGSAPTTEEFVLLDFANEKRIERNMELDEFPYDAVFGVHQIMPHFSRRTFPCSFLKKIFLVDSPGVVSHASRPFDFSTAAELMTQESDLIFFFFNFEHSESLDVIDLYQSVHAAASSRNRHLLTILNRTDTADSIKDFAKTFATLMVNINRRPKITQKKEKNASIAPEIATGWLFPHWPQYYEMEKRERPRYLGDTDEFIQDAHKVVSHLHDAPIYSVRAKLYDLKLYAGRLLWHLRARKELIRNHFWNSVRFYGLHAILVCVFGSVCWFSGDLQHILMALVVCLFFAIFIKTSVSIPDIVASTKPSPWLPSSFEEEIVNALSYDIDKRVFATHEPALAQRCNEILHTHHPALEARMSEISLVSKQMGFMELDFEVK